MKLFAVEFTSKTGTRSFVRLARANNEDVAARRAAAAMSLYDRQWLGKGWRLQRCAEAELLERGWQVVQNKNTDKDVDKTV